MAEGPGARPEGPSLERWGLAALLFAAGLLYAPALATPLHYDDEAKLTRFGAPDPLGALGLALAGHGYAEPRARPLTWLSLAADRALWGPGPSGHHLSSVLLHLVAVLLLYRLGARLGRAAGWPPLAPLVAAALFAFHPLASEAVVYLNARGNLLVTVFTLAAVEALLAGRTAAFLALALLALSAKEVAISLALLAPLFAALLPPPSSPGPPGRRWGAIAALALAGAAAAAASGALGHALAHRPTAAALRGQVQAQAFYLFATLVPLPQLLSVDHRGFGEDPETAGALLLAGLLALAAPLELARALRRRQPALAALAAWPLLAHLPAALVPRAEAVVEYRAYLALAGSALLAGALVARRPLAAAAVALVLAAATGARLPAWESSVALWRDAAAKSPRSARAANNLGAALEAEGRLGDAVAAYAEAVRRDPDLALARYNLGTALARRGEWEAALAHLSAALRLRPEFAAARHNLERVSRHLERRE